jgi:membrane-associated phospholipid phosphatase
MIKEIRSLILNIIDKPCVRKVAQFVIIFIALHEVTGTVLEVGNSYKKQSIRQEVVSDVFSTTAIGVGMYYANYMIKIASPVYITYPAGLVAASATTFVLKKIVKKERPDKSDNKSFPSGHATIFGVCLFFILKNNKYAREKRFFLTLLIIIGCLCRVLAKKHDIYDISAGFGIGVFWSYVCFFGIKLLIKQ